MRNVRHFGQTVDLLFNGGHDALGGVVLQLKSVLH